MPATEGLVIEARDLTVHAGGRCVLDLPAWRVAAGSVMAVLGPNGAGKSTLLRACLGLGPAGGGTLRVLGQDVGALRGAALAALRRRVGYVPQLLPVRSELPLTVREVVAMGRTAAAGWFRRLSRADGQIVETWTDRLGLAPLADRPFHQISGGEQRKTIIARAMAQEPDLLLLDEPTANLDLGWRERLVHTIESLHAQTRLSVVLVCHELEVLPPACREVLLLEKGRLLAEGPPESVFTSERVSSLYGAPLRTFHEGGRHAVVPAEEARHG